MTESMKTYLQNVLAPVVKPMLQQATKERPDDPRAFMIKMLEDSLAAKATDSYMTDLVDGRSSD